MDHEQLRNLRDFLVVYNKMTEICFQRCSSNFNYRNLTMDEERCADSCAGKLIRTNNRLMGSYMQLMPQMVQRRMEEMESKASEYAEAEGATSPSAPDPVHSPATSLQPAQLPTPGAEVAPDSLLKSAGSAAESDPAAAAPPRRETLNVSAPSESRLTQTPEPGLLITASQTEKTTSAAVEDRASREKSSEVSALSNKP